MRKTKNIQISNVSVTYRDTWRDDAHWLIQRGAQGVLTLPPPTLKNHKFICLLRNTGTDAPKEAIGPLGPWLQLLLEGGTHGPL